MFFPNTLVCLEDKLSTEKVIMISVEEDHTKGQAGTKILIFASLRKVKIRHQIKKS